MAECEYKQWCTKECDKCDYSKEQEEIQAAVAAWENLKNSISENITPIIEKIINSFAALNEAIIKSYPNKRVSHLALYHPKCRTRKKNLHRIRKWFFKMIKDGEDE